MSIVPIHRRGANVEPHDRLPDRARPAPPDRVPILMRMPDLARIDGPQATLEMHAPPRIAGAPRSAGTPRRAGTQRPSQTTRGPQRPIAEASSRSSRPAPSRNDDDEADSDMSPAETTKVRAGSHRRSKHRREIPGSPPTSHPAPWLSPTNIMVGAAVLAVIVSIVAMVRRPATQPIEASPPGWNSGGSHPPAVHPAPAAPIDPSAVAQPEQRQQASPDTPAPDRAPMHSDGLRRRPGAWSNTTQEPSQSSPTAPTPASQLPLPEPDPEPGQWSTRSAMRPPGRTPLPPPMAPPFKRESGDIRSSESPGTATLTGTIDKPEQPTLRAEHERIGQGVY